MRAIHAILLLFPILELILAILLLLRPTHSLLNQLQVKGVVPSLGSRNVVLLLNVECLEFVSDDHVSLQLGCHLNFVCPLLCRPAQLHLRHVLLHHMFLLDPPPTHVGALVIQHPQRRLIPLPAQLHFRGVALFLFHALPLVHLVKLRLFELSSRLDCLLLNNLIPARVGGGDSDGLGVAHADPVAPLAPLSKQHLLREVYTLLLALFHKGTRASLQRGTTLLRGFLTRHELPLQPGFLRLQLAS
mmetsp:Transcript_17575/g.43538  ORF Transcript_17575/g.43538 Transcript_17575/m.43538 type:complete len:245 (-) Transcript_17575:449-1183(-)